MSNPKLPDYCDEWWGLNQRESEVLASLAMEGIETARTRFGVPKTRVWLVAGKALRKMLLEATGGDYPLDQDKSGG